MFKIANSKIFNSAKSVLLQTYGCETFNDKLYMKDSGELFLISHHEGIDDSITTADDAYLGEWVSVYGDSNTIVNVFGDIPDDDYERDVISFTAPKPIIEYIDNKAKEMGENFSATFEMMAKAEQCKPLLETTKSNKAVDDYEPEPFESYCRREHLIQYQSDYDEQPIVTRLMFIKKSIVGIVNRRADNNNIYWDDAAIDLVRNYMEEN